MSKYRRLSLKITPALHARLERAAGQQGKVLEQFVVQVLRRAAEAAVPANDVMHLSRKGQEAFVQALLNPDPPNVALKKALSNHKKLFGY